MKKFHFFITVFIVSVLQGQEFFPDALDNIADTEKKQSFSYGNSSPAAGTERYDIRYHRCIWKVDPARRYIQGSVTTYFRTVSDILDTLCFDLSDSLAVDSVRYNKDLLLFGHAGNLLQIFLPSSLGPDILDSVTVFYHGIPPSTGLGSFEISTHDGVPVLWTLSQPYGASDWWPCKNGLTDKADSADLYIATPPGYRAAGNGLLMSEIQTGTEWVSHWKHRYPIVTYLVAMAVSNYARYEHEVPYGNSMVPVFQYVYPEDSAIAVSKTPGIISIMQLYDTLFGLYPFAAEKYGQCQINGSGGMEHQTFTFMGNFDHELMSHELAHSWFGNMITCGSWEDIWLNEGFASYLTGLTYERMFDGYWWMPFKKNRLSKIVSQSGGSVWCDDTANVSRIFDSRLSYAKGAMILHQLRWIIGDSAFFAAVTNYLNDPLLRYGFAHTPDLVAHLESSARKDLDWYFSDWYTGQGFPSYQVTWTRSDDQITITVGQTQSHSSIPFFKLPLPVRFKNLHQDTLIRLEHTYSGEVFTVSLPFDVDSVLLDPDLWLISSGNTVSAIQEPSLEDQISVYPNPATDMAIIALPPHLEEMTIRLADLSGRLLRSYTVFGRSLFHLMLEDLPRGYYLLQFSNENMILTRSLILR